MRFSTGKAHIFYLFLHIFPLFIPFLHLSRHHYIWKKIFIKTTRYCVLSLDKPLFMCYTYTTPLRPKPWGELKSQ